MYAGLLSGRMGRLAVVSDASCQNGPTQLATNSAACVPIRNRRRMRAAKWLDSSARISTVRVSIRAMTIFAWRLTGLTALPATCNGATDAICNCPTCAASPHMSILSGMNGLSTTIDVRRAVLNPRCRALSNPSIAHWKKYVDHQPAACGSRDSARAGNE